MEEEPDMEEKQSLVIQGRTIERERAAERLSQNRHSRSDRHRPAGDFGQYGLSALRETGRPVEGEVPSVQRNTHSRMTLRSRSTPSFRTRERSVSERMVSEGRSPYRRMASPPRPRTGRRSEEPIPQSNPLMIKIAVSVLIALVFIILQSIRLPFAQTMAGYIRTAVTHEFDLEENLGKLKFVEDLLPDRLKEVFGQESGQSDSESKEVPADSIEFTSPVRGEVVHTFGEQIIVPDTGRVYANQGIDVKTGEDAPVFASADGVVAAVEEHESYGPSVWLDHGSRVFTFYGGCGRIDVKVGQKVKAGQKLGSVLSSDQDQPLFHFQIWVNDKPTDPLEAISKAGQESKGRGV